MSNSDNLVPVQIRMAKAALGWSNTDVAAKTGLHKNTAVNAEAGRGRPATLALLRLTFARAGVVFIDADEHGGPGVRLKSAAMESRPRPIAERHPKRSAKVKAKGKGGRRG